MSERKYGDQRGKRGGKENKQKGGSFIGSNERKRVDRTERGTTALSGAEAKTRSGDQGKKRRGQRGRGEGWALTFLEVGR